MNIENNKKVYLNRLSIIVGTKCNLKCKHCLGGDPNRSLKITPEIASNLIDNLSAINELTFAGYEISLNVDEVKMILDMLISRKIKVNYVTFITNCVSFNEELAHLFNDFRLNHTTFPDEALFQVSFDEFHFNNGFTNEKLQENFKLYTDIIGKCEYAINDLSDGLFINGRAKQLNPYELEKYPKIIVPLHKKNYLEFRKRCEGDRNTCNNGNCVCNCVTNIVVITPNGDIFADIGEAFDALNKGNSKYAVGNVKQNCLYDIFHTAGDDDLESTAGKELIFRDYYSYGWNANYLLYEYLKCREYLLLALKYGNSKIWNANIRIILNAIENVQNRTSVIEDDNDNDNDEKQAYLSLLNTVYEDFLKIEKLKDYYNSSDDKADAINYICSEFEKFCFDEKNFKDCYGYEYKTFIKLWDSYKKYDFETFRTISAKIHNIDYYEAY